MEREQTISESAQDLIFRIGSRDPLKITNINQFFWLICALLEYDPDPKTKNFLQYATSEVDRRQILNELKQIYLYYYTQINRIETDPNQALNNIHKFIRDMFIYESNFNLNLEDFDSNEEWYNSLKSKYPYIKEWPILSSDISDEEFTELYVYLRDLIADTEVWKASSFNPNNPYKWANNGEQGRLNWWQLDPRPYFLLTSERDPLDSAMLGNHPYDRKYVDLFNPDLKPWLRFPQNYCVILSQEINKYQNEIRQNLTPFVQQFPVKREPPTINIFEQEAVTESKPVIRQPVVAAPSSIVRQSIPSTIEQAPVCRIERNAQGNLEPVSCPVCFDVCIPVSIIRGFLKLDKDARGIADEENYRNEIYKEIKSFEDGPGKTNPQNIVYRIFTQYPRYPQELLMNFLQAWAERPSEDEYILHSGQQGICGTCAKGLAKVRREEISKTAYQGETIDWHYFVPFEQIEGYKTQPTATGGEEPLTQFTILRELITQAPPFEMLPEVLEEIKTKQYPIPSGRTEYQIPPNWKSLYLGPYAIVPGALVYYYSNPYIPAIPLSLGFIIEYDTDMWIKHKNLEGFSQISEGRYPKTAIIQPVYPYLGPNVVESILLDFIFPIGIVVPPVSQIFSLRGSQTLDFYTYSFDSLLPPLDAPLQQRIETITNIIVSGKFQTDNERKSLEASWRLLKEREELLGAMQPALTNLLDIITNFVAKEVQQGSSSFVLRQIQAPLKLFSTQQERNLLQSIVPEFDFSKVGQILSASSSRLLQVTLSPLVPNIDLIKGGPEDVDENGWPLVNPERGMDIVYRVVVIKYKQFLDLSRSKIDLRDSVFTVVAAVAGIEYNLVSGPRALGRVVARTTATTTEKSALRNTYLGVKTNWNNVFEKSGSISNPDYYNFPGPNGSPLMYENQTKFGAEKLIKESPIYSQLLKHVDKLSNTYKWLFDNFIPPTGIATQTTSEITDGNYGTNVRRKWSSVYVKVPIPNPIESLELFPTQQSVAQRIQLPRFASTQERQQYYRNQLLFKFSGLADNDQFYFLSPSIEDAKSLLKLSNGNWNVKLLETLARFHLLARNPEVMRVTNPLFIQLSRVIKWMNLYPENKLKNLQRSDLEPLSEQPLLFNPTPNGIQNIVTQQNNIQNAISQGIIPPPIPQPEAITGATTAPFPTIVAPVVPSVSTSPSFINLSVPSIAPPVTGVKRPSPVSSAQTTRPRIVQPPREVLPVPSINVPAPLPAPPSIKREQREEIPTLKRVKMEKIPSLEEIPGFETERVIAPVPPVPFTPPPPPSAIPATLTTRVRLPTTSQQITPQPVRTTTTFPTPLQSTRTPFISPPRKGKEEEEEEKTAPNIGPWVNYFTNLYTSFGFNRQAITSAFNRFVENVGKYEDYQIYLSQPPERVLMEIGNERFETAFSQPVLNYLLSQ